MFTMKGTVCKRIIFTIYKRFFATTGRSLYITKHRRDSCKNDKALYTIGDIMTKSEKRER